MEQLSKISEILQRIGKTITEDETRFLDVPIFWDIVEVNPDNIPDTGIIFSLQPYRLDDTGCAYERQLDIIIFHNTDYEREIILRLSKYAEDMYDLMEEYILKCPEDLRFLQGSEIRAKRNNRRDAESYKGTAMLFSSLIVLTYLLRY